MSYLITTRYYGPTNTKGSRIRVKNEGTGKVKFLPFNYAAIDAADGAAIDYAKEIGYVAEYVGTLGNFDRVYRLV